MLTTQIRAAPGLTTDAGHHRSSGAHGLGNEFASVASTDTARRLSDWKANGSDTVSPPRSSVMTNRDIR